ncbi:MAG: peptide chain release factor 1 [Planctomycetes bacterium]|nr:peptide chain release factor 1 [Planctomycetota bacterium]
MLEELEEKLTRFEQLERQMADPELLADSARSAAVYREHGRLARVVNKYRQYKDLTAQCKTTRRLIEAESDAEARRYFETELNEMQKRRIELWGELRRLAAGGDLADTNSLIVEIRAGTGGEEAALFARDLYDMYTRYAAKKGWKVESIGVSPTDHGGFREAIFSVAGDGVYQELQFESGGHRVQRVPETEAQGRIHTSAATVAVLPEPTEVQVEIRPEDLGIDTMRSGGPGGQHQNKTESGVRITHKPTGIVVNCRDEKSQHKNKAKAMRVLRSRLYEMMREKEHAQRADQRRNQIGSGDRSDRIRTYNFPQNRLTDHRIGLNLYHLDTIVAGNLDEVVDALVKASNGDELPPPE